AGRGYISAGSRISTSPPRQWRHGIRRVRRDYLQSGRRPRTDVPRRRRMVGTFGCDSSGLAQCQPHRARHLACDLHRTQGCNSSRPHEAALTMTNTHFTRCAPRATSPTSVMTPLLTLLFAVAVGVIVLPLYAAQPLISSIAASFDLSSGTMGLTTTMPMVG